MPSPIGIGVHFVGVFRNLVRKRSVYGIRYLSALPESYRVKADQ